MKSSGNRYTEEQYKAKLEEMAKRTGRDSQGRLAKLLDPNAAPQASPDAAKGNKFNAQKVEHDGIEFDSKKEGAHYLLLKQRMLAREISDLAVHVSIGCEVKGVHICTYEADFRYQDKDGNVIYEDCKGYRKGPHWAVFRLKIKLVEALHDIKVRIV